MKDLQAHTAIEEFFANKRQLEELEARNKEIIEELVKMTEGRDATIGNHKLSKVRRAGSISYATIIKEKLPNLQLDRYRGKPTEYWVIR